MAKLSSQAKGRSSCLFLFLFFLAAAISTKPVFGAELLAIRNQTSQEIINILVRPQKEPEFFLRLDLAPGRVDKVNNPQCLASLRVDTGLRFLIFEHVNLKNAASLVFCGEHDACVIILNKDNGQVEHINGKTQNLVPARGEKPVCELSRFRPRMAMKDVCAILEPDTPVDDNGSLITGLGFGGLVWAGRLTPVQNGKAKADSTLEHLELRRPLSRENIGQVLQILFKQGYVPWQAEFPGLDVDFADMPKQDEASQKRILQEAIDTFMRNQKDGTAIRNMAYRQDDEARILMAPTAIIKSLANADSPNNDVQLFTIALQPRISTLLLDVAAYEGEKNRENQ